MADDEVLRFETDLADLEAAKRALGAFKPRFRAGLKPRLLQVGQVIAGDVRTAIQAYPVRRQRGFAFVRDALADSLEVRTYGRDPDLGVLVVSTGKKLPESKQPLVKAWNRSQYRHPNFGGKGRGWSSQPGIRYFSGARVMRRQSLITRAFEETAAEAAAATEKGTR